MFYLNFVLDEDDDEVMHAAPVDEGDAAYLRRAITTLRPLSDAEYLNGQAVVLRTAARYRYILDGQDVCWCVEWPPGLLVLRFSPDSTMAWTALRSPVPDFGGRDADETEWEGFDEDAENPQYNLVFRSWDAQFDEVSRERRGFMHADSETQERFRRAMAHANRLGSRLEQETVGAYEAWRTRCVRNLEQWCGEGVRLPSRER